MLREAPPPSPSIRMVTPSWIDLFNATQADVDHVGQLCGIHIPTREELSEIESSSRLYVQDGAIYVSLPAVTYVDGAPLVSPFGLVLSPERLVTVRFAALPGMEALMDRVQHLPVAPGSVDSFLMLADTAIEGIADNLEHASAELDRLSRLIFRPSVEHRSGDKDWDRALRGTLRAIGQTGELVTKLHDVLRVIGRSLPFIIANAAWIPDGEHMRFDVMRTDITWLGDHATHAAQQVQFLQEATLGFINIEQNHIIKVLAIVATVGVPPTLLASMWGMNFEVMPELKLAYGYPLAITAILISACIPLAWFRKAGWL
jgi:magnesium transporter